MALVNFSDLDFDQIRSSIKSYLRANSTFTDYDFEGSNLSMLIDVLAYNTYLSSYNANMLSNEVFLDSATLRENVVSLAKNVGYLPKSVTSSKATVSFFIDLRDSTNNAISITLRKGLVCTSAAVYDNTSYIFSIPEDITVPVSNGIASFTNIQISEGNFVTEFFTVDTLNKSQKFILNNPKIDTNSIRVKVSDSETSSVSKQYKFVDNITDVKNTDDIFFLSEIADQRYELLFGDGTFGSKLKDNNFITVSYIVANGELANGVSEFVFVGKFVDNNGSTIIIESPLVTTELASIGGSDIESVASIKKYAPRVYSTQNRAVTSSDYEALMPSIYTETESVSVFGGEELDPPQYGKVFISIKPVNGSYVPNNVKDNLKVKLRKYSVAGIVPEFLDLKYLYIEYDSRVYYNSNLAKNSDDLKTTVTNNIIKYANSSELNKYGARFKYSKFLKIIDDGNSAITSNITRISIRRDLKIELKTLAQYEICFGNEFYVNGDCSGYNIKSSGFTVNGILGTVYFSDIPNSDKKMGKIVLFQVNTSSQPVIIRQNAGIIDYVKGEIKINPINIINTSKKNSGDFIIQFSTTPKSNDIIGKQDLYLKLDTNNSMVNILTDTISSGEDLSGSQYIISSSYADDSLTRN
jgi:hypothetical protein